MIDSTRPVLKPLSPLPSDVFAQRVRHERTRQKLSQAALASRVSALLGSNLDPTTVTRIEKNERVVRLDEAVAIAQALDVPLSLLVYADPISLNEEAIAAQRREMLDLSRSELSFVLQMLEHDLSAKQIALIEDGLLAPTVDDLTALAVALDTSPVAMLCYEITDPELGSLQMADEPQCTGLPADVSAREFTAWLHGLTTMRAEDRASFAENEAARTQILVTFRDDQLGGAYAELHEIDEATRQDTSAPAVQQLIERIHEYDGAAQDAHRAAELADMRHEAFAYSLRHKDDPIDTRDVDDSVIRFDDELPFG